MGLVNTGIKVPHVYKYTAVFLMLWAYISAGGPLNNVSCLDTWHHELYQIPTNKKSMSD